MQKNSLLKSPSKILKKKKENEVIVLIIVF